MSSSQRISPTEAREKVLADRALLICAYDSNEKFQANHLDRAISLDNFKSRLSELAKSTELIFYCG